MDDNKQFLKWFFAGAFASALCILFVFAGKSVFDRQVKWHGVDPNTKISEIYDLINRFSIMPHDKENMLDNMYKGFLEGVGDPYTQYFNHESLSAFRARTDGVFVGIGVSIFVEADDAYVTIASVFNDSPAARAGILPGDQIVRVNGTDVAGKPREDVVNMITGPEDTDVEITVFRPHDNKRIDFEITRAKVEVPSIFHEMHYTEYNDAVGYIRIESFDRATPGQFDSALTELYADGMNGLIIDVRNNPGGLLCAVNEITDRLIPEGIIVYTINAAGRRENSYSGSSHLGLPLVLLVNERSASASEVLSGAVRDTETGTLVGVQTFGKGIVQNLLPLSDGTAIKLTVQEYYTPNGENIHGVGIAPHVTVEMCETLSRRIGDLTLEEDIQLQKALEVLREKK
ncbi:MAG: S41 family peptidase [Defluviitaleaceae bacterium]|nr:S41 family peptidase [Defluviitaleaceae bacterium]